MRRCFRGAGGLLAATLLIAGGCVGHASPGRHGGSIFLPRPLATPPPGPYRSSAGDGRIVTQRHLVPDDVDDLAPAGRGPQVRDILTRVDVEAITYRSDGLLVQGYLALPRSAGAEAGTARGAVAQARGGKGTGAATKAEAGAGKHEGREARRFPCIIYNRGGSGEQGALTDVRAVLRLGKIAAHGYVVVASQYRGNAGSEGREDFGGADVDDVLNLIPLLERLPRADADRIGMYGWSRGGMMTYLALARTDRIAAAVVGAGLADARAAMRERPDLAERILPEVASPRWDPAAFRAAAEARSAVLWPRRLCKHTPILLLHGSADAVVDPSQALRMARALYEVKQPFRFVFFEGGDHGLTEYGEEVEGLVLEWFDRYVRDGRTWPSLEPHGEGPEAIPAGGPRAR